MKKQKKSIMKKLFTIAIIIISLRGVAQQKDSIILKRDTIKAQNLMEVVVKTSTPIVQIKTDKILLNVEIGRASCRERV